MKKTAITLLLFLLLLAVTGCGRREESEEISSIYNIGTDSLPEYGIDASSGIFFVEEKETKEKETETIATITKMDLSLKYLKVNDTALAVNIDQQDYTVGNDVAEINITAAPNDSMASVVSGIGTHKLEVGSNKIEIVVKATDKSKKTYTLNVIRKEVETQPAAQPPAQPPAYNPNYNYYYVAPEPPTVAPNNGVTIIG